MSFGSNSVRGWYGLGRMVLISIVETESGAGLTAVAAGSDSPPMSAPRPMPRRLNWDMCFPSLLETTPCGRAPALTGIIAPERAIGAIIWTLRPGAGGGEPINYAERTHPRGGHLRRHHSPPALLHPSVHFCICDLRLQVPHALLVLPGNQHGARDGHGHHHLLGLHHP